MTAKRITRLALFVAAAFVLAIIENALPPMLAFAPGAKMGLSNVVSLVALVVLGVTDAYFVLVARCLMSAVVSGNYFALAYSLTAGIVSLSLETLLIKTLAERLSIVSISFIGALAHNLTQLAVAGLIVKTNLVFALPLTLLASVVAGLTVGAAAYFTIKFLPERFYILPLEKSEKESI